MERRIAVKQLSMCFFFFLSLLLHIYVNTINFKSFQTIIPKKQFETLNNNLIAKLLSNLPKKKRIMNNN